MHRFGAAPQPEQHQGILAPREVFGATVLGLVPLAMHGGPLRELVASISLTIPHSGWM